MKPKYNPPICPSCKKPLDRLDLEEVAIMVFDPKEGTYTIVGGSEALDVSCTFCGEDVGGYFDDGPINYKAKVICDK